MAQYRSWVFTINNYTEEQEEHAEEQEEEQKEEEPLDLVGLSYCP